MSARFEKSSAMAENPVQHVEHIPRLAFTVKLLVLDCSAYQQQQALVLIPLHRRLHHEDKPRITWMQRDRRMRTSISEGDWDHMRDKGMCMVRQIHHPMHTPRHHVTLPQTVVPSLHHRMEPFLIRTPREARMGNLDFPNQQIEVENPVHYTTFERGQRLHPPGMAPLQDVFFLPSRTYPLVTGGLKPIITPPFTSHH